MENTDTIMDSDLYRDKKDIFGYKQIVLKQVQRCVDLYSRELTEGYFKESAPSQFGSQQIVSYVPDSRIAYIQAVEVLHDLLAPKFDKQAKTDIEQIESERLTKFSEHKGDNSEWPNIKIRIMRKLFQNLCGFLERLGWLEDDMSSEDE